MCRGLDSIAAMSSLSPPSPPSPPSAADAPAPPGAIEYIQAVEAMALSGRHRAIARLDYGPQAGQQLEVYVPSQARVPAAPLPVVIFFHGGAWIRGGLTWLDFMAPAVTALPAIFVAATYRLAPAHRWPAQYEDACDAIARVHRHIGEFGGNPGRLLVGGHSAGGHLAALAVLKREIPPVLGCLPVSAPCDLRFGDISVDSENGRAYKYLLQARSQDADASPVLFTEGNRVPFHVVWGSNDFERICRSSSALVAKLREGGSNVTESVVDGAGHFDTHLMLAQSLNPWYEHVARMLAGDQGRDDLPEVSAASGLRS